jgi:hypothetical protein
VADLVPPTVTARVPIAGAVNVAPGANITATFSENVLGVPNTPLGISTAANPGNFRLVRTSTNVVVTSVVSYNATTLTATLNPTANLVQGVSYTATLIGGAAAIRDASNNPLATTSWSFTTADTTAPTVTARTPGVNATGVVVPVSPTATFSEALNPATVNTTTMTVRVGTVITGALVPSVVTLNAANTIATINPNASLLPDTTYTVRLTNGITDVAGNPLAANQWTFITGPAPTITARTPAAGATLVPTTASATATFSEAMNAATITGANVTLRLGTAAGGTLIAATVTYNATTRVVTLDPTPTLAANTLYTVRLSTNVTDAAGNRLAAAAWTFRTA